MLETMGEATSAWDAAQRLAKHSRAPWLALQSVPLIFGLLLFFLYWCVCWWLAPWSMCWPCKPKEGELSRCCKVLLGIVFVLWTAQIGIAAMVTGPAYDITVAGFDNSLCSAADILDVTLSGQMESPQFIGMVPLLERLQRLAEDLEDDSALVANLTGLLNASAEIQEAMQVATGTLDLLGSVVSLPENVRPGSTTGRNLMHVSTLADGLMLPLNQAKASVADGRAGVLFAARMNVETRLSNWSRASMRSNLHSALESMAEFKRAVRDVMAYSLEPGRFQTLRNQVDGNLWYVTHLFLPHSALILLISLLSVLLIARHQHCHALGAKLAWCSWECGCCFLLPAFLIGGFLLALTPSLAGMCLIATDLNSEMLQEISGGIAVDMSADKGVIMGDLADRCFSVPSDSSVSTSLFDIVYGRDDVTDEKRYLRDQLVGRFAAPLEAAFSRLASLANATTLGDAAVVALLSALQESEADVLLVPNSTEMLADLVLAKLSADEALSNGLTASSKCSNQTGGGGSSSDVVLGMRSFMDRLLELGVADGNVTMGCLQSVDCSPSAGTDAWAACDAGNALVELKVELVDPAPAAGGLFRCDVFERADGSSCDLVDMRQDSQGMWLDDCLRPSGFGVKTLKVKEQSCTLQEFTAYVKEFEGRVKASVERLDWAATRVASVVDTDLRAVIFGQVLDVNTLSHESSCSYMPELYQDMLEGVCYQGVSGLVTLGYAYVGSGVMMLLATFVMYTFWRTHAKQLVPLVQDGSEGAAEATTP